MLSKEKQQGSLKLSTPYWQCMIGYYYHIVPGMKKAHVRADSVLYGKLTLNIRWKVLVMGISLV